jgi:hypothetical protein
LFLSFFTVTLPRAAGTTDEVSKAIFLAQELNKKILTILKAANNSLLSDLFFDMIDLFWNELLFMR